MPLCIVSEWKLLVILRLHLICWPIKIEISWGFVTICECMLQKWWKIYTSSINYKPSKTRRNNSSRKDIHHKQKISPKQQHVLSTSQKTNITPEQWWLQNYFPFSGDILNSRGGGGVWKHFKISIDINIYIYNQIYTTNCMYAPYSVLVENSSETAATPCGPILRFHRFDRLLQAPDLAQALRRLPQLTMSLWKIGGTLGRIRGITTRP